ncbi:MAG: 1-acyl-sn-glycerol-3-phosphate acyltransferase [Bacilli bacterium]|nr:1-acyl-sn-glycerol-3-phosphate acyltransferase [Bacilli bacterium]
MSKDKKWVKARHKVIKRWMYAYFSRKIPKVGDITWEEYNLDKGKNYIILFNHQTDYDQIVLGLSFPKVPIYYVSTEDFFSNGFKSKILRYAVNPIPIKKQTIDALAARRCVRVAKEGGTIAIAPEGNRTFSGITCNIKPSIAKLIKMIKLPIIFYEFSGGYGVQPRWADDVRRGPMHGSIKKILEYDDYKNLSNEELFEIIKNNLYHDDYTLKKTYNCDNLANYLERVFYLCPKCGMSEFVSEANKIRCKRCGLEATYNIDKTFASSDSAFIYKNPSEWFKAQEDYILNIDLNTFDGLICQDEVALYKVIYLKRKVLLDDKAIIELYKDKYIIKCKDKTYDFSFDDVFGVSVLGRNKINIYIGEDLYQIKPPVRFNAIKYAQVYYKYRIDIGKNEDKYLGF